jgi:hypothetical protein
LTAKTHGISGGSVIDMSDHTSFGSRRTSERYLPPCGKAVRWYTISAYH